jgi:hypothetical protein
MVTVLATDLTTPPSAGVTYTTTLMNGHEHMVSLSAAQLTSIEAGQEVTVTSSSTGHTHAFMIMKA